MSVSIYVVTCVGGSRHSPRRHPASRFSTSAVHTATFARKFHRNVGTAASVAAVPADYAAIQEKIARLKEALRSTQMRVCEELHVCLYILSQYNSQRAAFSLAFPTSPAACAMSHSVAQARRGDVFVGWDIET